MTDWDGILSREGPAVWRTVYRLLGRRADAEDCFQETFLAALQAWRDEADAGREVANPRALLHRLATARAIDRLRSRYRQGRRERDVDPDRGLDALPGQHRRPEEHAASAELASALRAALAAIPERQAEVFCLHCLDGWSYEEIARHTGATVDNVGVLLHRARGKLRTLLKPAARAWAWPIGKGKD